MLGSTVCSGAYQRIHQSSASLAFVRGIYRLPVKYPHKGLVTRKMFPFYDVIMRIKCNPSFLYCNSLSSTIGKSRCYIICDSMRFNHDDVIKWKHFPRNWPFVRGIHRSPVNSPHKGQWRGALMFTLICAWINGWVNTREAGDLRRYRPDYDVIVMSMSHLLTILYADCVYQLLLAIKIVDFEDVVVSLVIYHA